MADTTTASQGLNLTTAIGSIADDALKGFTVFESAQVAQSAAKKLNSSGTVYVVLGLGALALVGLAIFLRR